MRIAVVGASTGLGRCIGIELANPGGLLKPGMFATLAFLRGEERESVLVPSESVIRTGTRNVVIVSLGEGRFRAANVEDPAFTVAVAQR